MNEIKYIVKPEDGIVIGIMKNTKDIYDEVTQSAKCDNLLALISVITDICAEYPSEIKAIARVKDGDTFDEVIGKRIVEKKLYRKLHDRLARQYSQLQDIIEDLYKTALNMESIHVDKYAKISEDYYEKYVKKEAE